MTTDSVVEIEIDRLDHVVIVAAVAAVLGPSARIQSIRPLGPRHDGSWMREGRLALQTSHRMRDPLMRLAAPRKAFV